MRQNKGPKKNRRQLLVALLAGALALLLLLPFVFMILENMALAGAASVGDIQGEIDKLKDQNEELADQKSELQNKLKSLQADKSQAMDKKALLEEQIGLIEEEIANLDSQLERYALLIDEKETQVAENEAREQAQFELFCKQCRAMEKEGSVSYWSILFSASSFADLLDKVNTVNAIADYNDLVCDQLQAARDALKEAQAELEAAQAETETARQSRADAQAELADQEAQVQTLIQELAGNEAETQDAIADLEAAAQDMDAQIAAKEKELEAAIAEAKRKEEEARQQQAEQSQSGSTSVSNPYQFDPGTGFYWPLPMERVSITSFFGYRKDPFTGKTSNHSGTDIGAYAGTPIYAAHGGVVLTSEYHSSYGNYVVLSRGDGVTTLYAHMSKRAVSEGQVVTQGQIIGYVGSTGRSTAPHLHFEIRVNGVRKDALQYYPNVQWKNNTGFPYT